MYLTYSLGCLAHWSPILPFFNYILDKETGQHSDIDKALWLCICSQCLEGQEWYFHLICSEATDELGRKCLEASVE